MRWIKNFGPILAAAVAVAGLATAALAQEPQVKGRTYTLGKGKDAIPVVEVWGSGYEMGYALGKLTGEEIRDTCATSMPLMLSGMGKTPAQVDEAYQLQAKHIPQPFKDEMQGLADGSGLPV